MSNVVKKSKNKHVLSQLCIFTYNTIYFYDFYLFLFFRIIYLVHWQTLWAKISLLNKFSRKYLFYVYKVQIFNCFLTIKPLIKLSMIFLRIL